jgi:two-component system response regulator MtrA
VREGVAAAPAAGSGSARVLDLRPTERAGRAESAAVPDPRASPEAGADDGVVVCVGLAPEQALAVLQLVGRATSVVLAPDAAHAVRLLGRSAPEAPDPEPQGGVHRVGDLEVDRDARQVTCRGRAVPVSAREFDLLVVLAGESGRVHGFGELTERVWSRDYLGDDDSVASAVKRLRRRLAAATDEVRVESVRGIGYRLVAGPETGT